MNDATRDALVYWGGGAFALLMLGAVVALRTFSDGRIEVRVTDVAIALIPFVLILLVSGKVKDLRVGGDGLSISMAEAFTNAANLSVAGQVDVIAPQEIETGGKGGLERIDDYVADGLQALTFRAGSGGYAAWAVEEYVRRLSDESPAFRWVALERDAALAGMIEAADLLAAVDAGRLDWDRFVDWVRDDPAAFAALRGWVPADEAVIEGASKRDALKAMDAGGRDWLPAVDRDGRLVGVLDRARVTAALIVEVADRIDAAAGN